MIEPTVANFETHINHVLVLNQTIYVYCDIYIYIYVVTVSPCLVSEQFSDTIYNNQCGYFILPREPNRCRKTPSSKKVRAAAVAHTPGNNSTSPVVYYGINTVYNS